MPRLQECPCGSHEYPHPLKDGYGIFLCYACSKCVDEKLKDYREDIFTRYDTDETIELEDY